MPPTTIGGKWIARVSKPDSSPDFLKAYFSQRRKARKERRKIISHRAHREHGEKKWQREKVAEWQREMQPLKNGMIAGLKIIPRAEATQSQYLREAATLRDGLKRFRAQGPRDPKD